MRRLLALASGIGLLALTGCSQVGGLAPVGGDALRSVSIAANDILEQGGIALTVVPVCVQKAKAATCTGKTAEGSDIAVIADLNVPMTMTVTVGDTQIYSGSVQDVIDKAARR